MSTNCLVTKLKATVNNSKLEKLGVVKLSFYVSAGTNRLVFFDVVKDKECKITITTPGITISGALGNCTKLSNNAAILRNKGNANYNGIQVIGTTATEAVTFEAEIENKYSLTSVTNWRGDLSQFNDKQLLHLIYINGIGNATGNLSNIKALPAIESLLLTGVNPNVTGKVSRDLGSMTTIKNLQIVRGIGLESDSLEAFVAAQRAAGRTDTSAEDARLQVAFGNGTQMTFNGSLITIATLTTFYWTATTITFGTTTIEA